MSVLTKGPGAGKAGCPGPDRGESPETACLLGSRSARRDDAVPISLNKVGPAKGLPKPGRLDFHANKQDFDLCATLLSNNAGPS